MWDIDDGRVRLDRWNQTTGPVRLFFWSLHPPIPPPHLESDPRIRKGEGDQEINFPAPIPCHLYSNPRNVSRVVDSRVEPSLKLHPLQLEHPMDLTALDSIKVGEELLEVDPPIKVYTRIRGED